MTTPEKDKEQRHPHVHLRLQLVDPDNNRLLQSSKMYALGDFIDPVYTRQLEYLFQDILGEFRDAFTEIHRQQIP